jgi:hypothetical protein
VTERQTDRLMLHENSVLNKTFGRCMERVIRRLDYELHDLCCSEIIGRKVVCRCLRGAEQVALIGGERDRRTGVLCTEI